MEMDGANGGSQGAGPGVADVLVVGAGPTGLVLALWLKRRGVAVRIIDKATEPGQTSRALVVHARTLELYRQLGLADDVVARGLKFTAVNLWARGRHAARVELGAIGRGLTPYPEMMIFPQDQHERLLVEHLARAGVEVERGVELRGLEVRADRVHARLARADGVETTCEAAYLAGCDGARSAVREGLGIGFPGGTYARVFYVADVQLRGPEANGELHLGLDEADFLGVFPLPGAGAARLIGSLPVAEGERHDLTWQDVSPRALAHMHLSIERVSWFSTYRVHHRVADTFRTGRAFLVGDAAHIHSPVGGQGMNTGIGDAANLAWKLVEVLQGRATERLLDSYEPERIAFARRLVATTDRAFTLVTREGWLARGVRTGLVPRLLPALASGEAFRRLAFRTLSQTAIDYRHGPLAGGGVGAYAGHVRPGDRLPWVAPIENGDGAGADNFAPLVSLDWQVHVYGRASAPILEAAARWGVPVHILPWRTAAADAGLAREVAYLVRPDGYVATADRPGHVSAMDQLLDMIGRPPSATLSTAVNPAAEVALGAIAARPAS
jgi:2-polyprenyl-6-methoxyphenol hydroxylase-like FAD-dependent oxidoreductase